MQIVHADTPATSILPGGNGVGVVAVQLPQTDDPKPNGTPTVLRMVFPGDGPHPVIATLVL